MADDGFLELHVTGLITDRFRSPSTEITLKLPSNYRGNWTVYTWPDSVEGNCPLMERQRKAPIRHRTVRAGAKFSGTESPPCRLHRPWHLESDTHTGMLNNLMFYLSDRWNVNAVLESITFNNEENKRMMTTIGLLEPFFFTSKFQLAQISKGPSENSTIDVNGLIFESPITVKLA